MGKAKDDFAGFSKDAVKFLQDLRDNNSRDWFNANKTIYETALKSPAAAFCEIMTGELETLTGIAHDAKVYRIHRDIRFSKDKTPYNSHLHISFVPRSGPEAPPHWFFGLQADSLALGTGQFAFAKGALDTYRERVAGGDGEKLAKILAGLERKGVRLSEPDLKRVPAPFEKDHANGELLRRKGLAAWIDFPDPAAATAPDLVNTCMTSFRSIKPLHDWLMTLP